MPFTQCILCSREGYSASNEFCHVCIENLQKLLRIYPKIEPETIKEENKKD